MEDLRTSSFRPGTYHVLHRNCNHFSDTLLQEVCGARVPVWVNRAACLGAGLTTGPGSSSGSSAKDAPHSFPAPGKTKPPTLSASIIVDDNNAEATGGEGGTSTSSSVVSHVFNWFFGGTSSSATSASSQGLNHTSSSAQALHAHSPSSSGGDVKMKNQKKELTEKQKAMLEKLKKNGK